jgi:hypothetical protein
VRQGGVRWELVVARSGWMPFGEESRKMLRLILLENLDRSKGRGKCSKNPAETLALD